MALATAPTLLPESYSWLSHTTSESAAQGVDGAWLARLGFLLFGLSVILLSTQAHHGTAGDWGRPARSLHTAFGVLMVAAGVFSARSWTTQAHYDPVENALHSVVATTMGFAFAFGVAAVAVWRWRQRSGWRILDVTAVAASVILPLGMAGWPELAGVLQRAMFAIAYTWYAAETVRLVRLKPSGPSG